MTTSQLLPDQLAYLKELALDIASHGGINGKTMQQAVAEAHSRRQAFAADMSEGLTRRSQMARHALGTAIWLEVQKQEAPKRMMSMCDHIDQR